MPSFVLISVATAVFAISLFSSLSYSCILSFLNSVIQSWSGGCRLGCDWTLGPSSPAPTPCGWTPAGHGPWSRWAGRRRPRQPAGSSSSTPTASGTPTTPAWPAGWSVMFKLLTLQILGLLFSTVMFVFKFCTAVLLLFHYYTSLINVRLIKMDHTA